MEDMFKNLGIVLMGVLFCSALVLGIVLLWWAIAEVWVRIPVPT